MAPKILWDEVTKHFYETGISKGVLYVQDSDGNYPLGVAWNGITGVSENPTGAESNKTYADNIVYLNLISLEQFGATLTAYTYPEEFGVCDGSLTPTPGVHVGQQPRKQFGLCFRTVLGNDTAGVDYGYKLHFIWGCYAAPTQKDFKTINDSPEAIEFSWDITTTPVQTAGFKPVAQMVIDSTKCDATLLAALEVILYGVAGSPGTAARLPLPAELLTLITPAG